MPLTIVTIRSDFIQQGDPTVVNCALSIRDEFLRSLSRIDRLIRSGDVNCGVDVTGRLLENFRDQASLNVRPDAVGSHTSIALDWH